MRRVALFLLAALALLGCEEVKKRTVDPRLQYEAQTSPAGVLHNLQTSYLTQDAAGYGRLLADDFRFYFDEGTRQQNHLLPVFWTHIEDTLQTSVLFAAPEVTDIRVVLRFGEAQPSSEVGRTDWSYIDVLDTFLEVDIAPRPWELEGTTFRVDGQKQRFYFRKGRTTEDTSSESWYLVEWKDFGLEDGKIDLRDSPLIAPTTWGSIKSLSRR